MALNKGTRKRCISAKACAWSREWCRKAGPEARARGNTGQERHNHCDSGEEGGLEEAEVGRGPGASGSLQMALGTSTPKSCPCLSSVEGRLL